jgi:cysteinyl-tRNA synthetase
MDDDFNTPQALGALFDLGRALYERLEQAGTHSAAREALIVGVAELQRLGGALGLFQRGWAPPAAPPEVERLVAERTEARRRRDWKRSDELRQEILGLGWQLEDTPAGARLVRRAT